MSELSHLPINPIRRNHREIVFSACWKQLMESDAELSFSLDEPYTMLESILDHHPEHPGEREAQVLATIITWFGTNVGRGFLEKCGFFSSDAVITPESMLSAWALENRRRRPHNSGWRTLEHLLTDREAHTQHLGNIRQLDLQRCSALDYEAAEHLMLWIGEPEGQAFIRQVIAMSNSVHIEQLLAAYDHDGLDGAYVLAKSSI